MTRVRLLLACVILYASSGRMTFAADLDPKDRVFFEQKVRPLLVDHCYRCHSAESEKLRGNLLLDSRAGWEKGGDSGPAILPGNPDESPLIEAVRYGDPAKQMPPKGKLPDESIAVLVEWVKRGAPDPRTGPVARPKARTIDIEAGRKHWAFQPLHAVAPPEVKKADWPRGTIDRFILAGLESKSIAPNEEATRRILIRRASFDLTGVPPTPEEVSAFLADSAPDAYEKVVDRLLASPRLGERWARHWLDLARWAESHGFEHDYDRPTAYPYRDFVIEAFNRDLPFDTFVKWQLAGDEFEPENPLALKATGFLAAGTHSTQITANQVEKERYDELDDMTNIAGTGFLGLTVGCARCHDHKYDPIPSKDYYRLVSTFTTTVRSEVDLNLDPEGFKKSQARYEADHAPYLAAIARYEAEELPGRFAEWEARPAKKDQAKWVVLDPSKMESAGSAKFSKNADGSILVSGQNPEFDTYTIVAACDMPSITGVKLEALADPSLVAGGPGRAANGNFALTDFRLTVGPRYGIGKTEKAELVNPKSTFEQPGLPIAATIDSDPKSGWAVDPQFGKDHAAVFELARELKPDGGATLSFRLEFANNAGHNIGRFRISVTDAPPPIGLDGSGLPTNIAAILKTPRESRTSEQTQAILSWYKTIDPQWRSLKAAADEHAKTIPQPAGIKALISTEGLPALRLHTQGADFLEKTHVLKRGDPNQKGEVAEPGFLQVLSTAPEGESRWKIAPPPGRRTSFRRASLANWMTDPDHGAGHLLARVIANRLWQHHMGIGLVSTPSDFGRQAEPPSHPELLDFLASELIRNGWKLKPIHRLIMTSATYRQSSRLDPRKESIDISNRLCWRYPKRRLEAEAIRDSMLFVSGQLDERMYGPGSLDERMKRRSIYFTVKRSKLLPMMMLFDAPDSLTGLASRATTVVAPQSLLLMNSPIVREWSEGLSRRITAEAPADTERFVRRAYLVVLGRDPDAFELQDALDFLAPKPSNSGDPANSSRAKTDFCQVLLGLNEFMFVE